jgi:hypothetical protein
MQKVTPVEMLYARKHYGIDPQYVSDSDKKWIVKHHRCCLHVDKKRGVPLTWRNIPTLMVVLLPIDLAYDEDTDWTAMAYGEDRKGRGVRMFVTRSLAIHLGWTIDSNKAEGV